MAGVNRKGEGVCEKGEGRKEEMPAVKTGLFTLRPPISW